MTFDPVCGMTVDPAKAAGASTYGGETYHFCSSSCEAKFDAAPAEYVSKPAETASCGSTAHACACC